MTGMQLVAVNIGRPERIPGYRPLTGICKRALDGPVAIGELGLADDAILDRKRHGGPDQAVYLYGRPDYELFERELGRALPPGLFGENLTVAGLDSRTIKVGDRFAIGEVVLEATAPRIPCATFAARMGDPHWVKRFFAANRPGVYARVLHGGLVEAGMPVGHTPYAGEPVLLTELMADYQAPAPERMRRLLKAPIHRKLVEHYTARLAQGDLFG